MVSHLQQQELGAKYPLPRWLVLAAPVLRGLLWPFRPWIRNSIPGRVGRVERMEAEGKIRDAFELALASAPLCQSPRRIPFLVMQARVLEELSRWRWADGDAPAAISLARQATEADSTWPYAHVTLAFYAQHSGLEDPLPPLIDAVRADPGCLAHIESSFNGSPELVRAVRSAVEPS